MRTHTWLIALLTLTFSACTVLAEAPAIPRVLPPEGMELPKGEQEKLETRIEKIRELAQEKEKQGKFTLSVAQDADIEIFLLAVEFALEFHEFYDPKDLAKATGSSFDRLFLTGMIQHHTGALIMVEDLFDTPGAGQDNVLFDFATDVDNTQRAEIVIMQDMLKEKP